VLIITGIRSLTQASSIFEPNPPKIDQKPYLHQKIRLWQSLGRKHDAVRDYLVGIALRMTGNHHDDDQIDIQSLALQF